MTFTAYLSDRSARARPKLSTTDGGTYSYSRRTAASACWSMVQPTGRFSSPARARACKRIKISKKTTTTSAVIIITIKHRRREFRISFASVGGRATAGRTDGGNVTSDWGGWGCRGELVSLYRSHPAARPARLRSTLTHRYSERASVAVVRTRTRA